MKNPENKPLRLVYNSKWNAQKAHSNDQYPIVLSNLAIAQAMASKHKSSAWTHFIAIVKELEEIYNFKFEKIDE